MWKVAIVQKDGVCLCGGLSPGPSGGSCMGRPQAGPALAVRLPCPQPVTSLGHGAAPRSPARAAADSGDRWRGPQSPSCPTEGSPASPGCAAEGSWEAWGETCPILLGFHCNTELFGTGVGGAGQSLDPWSCRCRVIAHHPNPFSAAQTVLSHLCGHQLTSLSLQNSPDLEHPKGLSGRLTRAGPSRALIAPRGCAWGRVLARHTWKRAAVGDAPASWHLNAQ